MKPATDFVAAVRFLTRVPLPASLSGVGFGAAAFPIDEHVVFDQSRGVPHSGYFANEDARSQITDWLNRN